MSENYLPKVEESLIEALAEKGEDKIFQEIEDSIVQYNQENPLLFQFLDGVKNSFEKDLRERGFSKKAIETSLKGYANSCLLCYYMLREQAKKDSQENN